MVDILFPGLVLDRLKDKEHKVLTGIPRFDYKRSLNFSIKIHRMLSFSFDALLFLILNLSLNSHGELLRFYMQLLLN